MRIARRFSSLLLVLGFATGVLLAQTPETAEIKKININHLQDKLVILIEIDRGIAHEHFALSNPNRLVIDFTNVDKTSAEPFIEVNRFGVKRIITSELSPSSRRIVFYLDEVIPSYNINRFAAGLEISFTHEIVEEAEEKPAKKPKEKVKRVETKEALIEPKKRKNSAIGFLTGYYYMQDQVFKEIYDKYSIFFGGEYSFVLPIKPIKSLDIWLGIKHMQNKGKTTFLEEDIKLRMIHLSTSFRYIATFHRVMPFIGPGIDYIVYKESYPEGFPVESIEDSAFGFHIQVGSYFNIADFLSAKLYFKFNNAKTTKEDIRVNLGGTEWGLGLIYRFNL